MGIVTKFQRRKDKHGDDHGLTLAYLLSAQLDVVRREARRVLTGTFVPQQFFKRRGNKRRIVSQALHRFRITQQREDAVSD